QLLGTTATLAPAHSPEPMTYLTSTPGLVRGTRDRNRSASSERSADNSRRSVSRTRSTPELPPHWRASDRSLAVGYSTFNFRVSGRAIACARFTRGANEG